MYQNKKSETLTVMESDAVRLAAAFRQFIQQIKMADQSTNMDLLLVEYIPLHNDALNLLNAITLEYKNKPYSEITNLYYQQFMLQLSQYNQLFNEVTIMCGQDQPAITIYEGCDAFSFLQEKLLDGGIGSIVHTLLKQTGSIRMTAIVDVEQTFSDINKNIDNHYFYHMPPDVEDFKKKQSALDWKNNTSRTMDFFAPPKTGEARESFFKHADRDAHREEFESRKSIIANIKAGMPVTMLEVRNLKKGTYYHYQSPVRFGSQNIFAGTDFQITHMGHGSEFIALHSSPVPLYICVNPVDDSAVSWSRVRHTNAPFETDDYPAINIVLLTDYNPKHLSVHTLKALCGKSSTLFIVPQGCGQLLRSSGLKYINIVEVATFNAVIDIRLSDHQQRKAHYQICSFPANHVCTRPKTEPYEAMSTGYLIRDMSAHNAILYTGNTAPLREQHMKELYAWCRKHELQIRTACISFGPDRPRDLLQERYQSTMDALIMSLELTRLNHHARTEKNMCYAWGNHQGCFAQGLTSFKDVDATMNRILALLLALNQQPISEIHDELLQNYLMYHFMDSFEQKGFLNLLSVYEELHPQAAAYELHQYICRYTYIPKPGERIDFSHEPGEGFNFDYERLFFNRNPQLKDYNQGTPGACEYFLLHLNPQLYESDRSKRDLVKNLLTLYTKRPKQNYLVEDKIIRVQEFLHWLPKEADLENGLGKLYQLLFPKADNKRRDEGHAQTVFLLLAGFLHFPDFCAKMALRHKELHDSVAGIKLEEPSLDQENFCLDEMSTFLQ